MWERGSICNMILFCCNIDTTRENKSAFLCFTLYYKVKKLFKSRKGSGTGKARHIRGPAQTEKVRAKNKNKKQNTQRKKRAKTKRQNVFNSYPCAKQKKEYIFPPLCQILRDTDDERSCAIRNPHALPNGRRGHDSK